MQHPVTSLPSVALALLAFGCNGPQPAGVPRSGDAPGASGSALRPVPAPSDPRGTPLAEGDGGAPCASVARWLAYPATMGEGCDASRCTAAGGTCAYAGMSCPLACIRRTTDGGKPCRDSVDCQSGCFADKGVPAGQTTQGTCHPLTLAVGCVNPVSKGRAIGVVCGD
jgi:hypothetical protein